MAFGPLVALAAAAAAQTHLAVQDSRGHQHAQIPDRPEAPSDALSLELIYTADAWRNASGGERRGSRYLDNLDMLVSADLERLVGWRGATGFVYGLYNNGRSISELIGDAQAASNIETGIKAARLYEAWIDQRIGRASFRVGLYDLNSEFDALEASALFMGSPHGIGTDFSQSGRNGPSIFPVTSLGARLAIDLSDDWIVRAAILDGVPGDPRDPRRTAVRLGDGEGALIVAEVEHRRGDVRLIGGYWRYNAVFDRHDGRHARGNDGAYLRGEARLTGDTGDAEQGLAAFFRLGVADASVNPFAGFASVGLNYTGALPQRPSDQLGLAIATAFTGRQYRRITPSPAAETAIELTYRATLAPFLTVQPNLQYVISPAGGPAVANALAVGLRTEFSVKF